MADTERVDRRKIGIKSAQKRMSITSRLKIQKALKGKNSGKQNGMYGISPSNKGKPMSEEQKQKLRDAWKRRKLENSKC